MRSFLWKASAIEANGRVSIGAQADAVTIPGNYKDAYLESYTYGWISDDVVDAIVLPMNDAHNKLKDFWSP